MSSKFLLRDYDALNISNALVSPFILTFHHINAL